MKEEIKTEWIRRLRSGLYPQGKGQLCEKGMFCCLGVLCEIAIEQGVITKTEQPNGVIIYDNEDGVLTPFVQQWSGIESAGGQYQTEDLKYPKSEGGYAMTQQVLVEDNDSGKTFEEIADIIEAKF